MKTQIMLDLETLGTKPDSVIVSIGAVKFSPTEIYDSFYEHVLLCRVLLIANLQLSAPAIGSGC